MKKIPTLFVRNPDDRRYVLNEVTSGCEWVLAGEGIATRKYDGTCVAISLRGLYARREVKPGKQAPDGFVESDFDAETGKTVGWEPMGSSPFAKFFNQAYGSEDGWKIGTYELCGPKINGNPEGYQRHVLVKHSDAQTLLDAPRDFAGLRTWLLSHPYEGIVWHHPDGRMAKIKRRDFA